MESKSAKNDHFPGKENCRRGYILMSKDEMKK